MKLRNFFVALVTFSLTSTQVSLADENDLSGMYYGLAYMNNWSNCNGCSSISSLHYTDDQINQLDTQLNHAGMNKMFKFDNMVWNSTMIEDYFGGLDVRLSDNVELFALSSHGWTYTNSVTNKSVYRATLCNSVSEGTCYAHSDQMVYGEQSSSIYGSDFPGYARWLILATCYSLDVYPSQQWEMSHRYGVDMFMGYRGTSSDSEYTDEVLADFAEHAFGGESKFKQVWFSATEDWYIDDTSEIMTCNGSNTGTTSDDATYRLNNYTRTWAKRLNDGTQRICSWAWHQG